MCASATEVDKFHFELDLYPNGIFDDSFDGADEATISTTRAAHSLFLELKNSTADEEGFVLYLWIKTWRDDFDPNNTKASQNQVWLMTNTICAPPTEKRGGNTFFMAIGQKGDDHQQVEKLFADELSCLSKGKTFYHGGLKKIISVKAGIVSICVDCPEQTSIFQIGDHNGSYSVYFGHATKVDGKCEDNCLPSCPFCQKKQLQNQLSRHNSSTEQATMAVEDPLSSCSKKLCSSWNVYDESFHSEAPAQYPTVCDERPGAPLAPSGHEITGDTGKDRQLPCIHLTIEWLEEAILFAHHQLKTDPLEAMQENATGQRLSLLPLCAHVVLGRNCRMLSMRVQKMKMINHHFLTLGDQRICYS